MESIWPPALEPGLPRSMLASCASSGCSRLILAICARFCFMLGTITRWTTPGNSHAIVSMWKRHPELVDKSARLTSTLYDHLVRSKLILRRVIFYGAALQCWGMLSLPGLLVDALRKKKTSNHQHCCQPNQDDKRPSAVKGAGLIFSNSSDDTYTWIQPL